MSAARPIALLLALTLAWPTPAFALRPRRDQAGLEEALRPAAGPSTHSREAARQKIITSLRQHPGGRTNVYALAKAAGMSWSYWYKLGGSDLLEDESAARLEEDAARRAHDQPLRPLIILKRRVGYDAHAALQEVLRQTNRYFLPPGEAARLAGISVMSVARVGYRRSAFKENARRERANTLRRQHQRPPIPRVGTTSQEAAAYVLEDQSGGHFSSKELAHAVGASGGALRPYRVRQLYKVENARRLTERESRKTSNQPWRRLALTVEEAIQFALEDHPGGQVTLDEFAAFAGVNRKTLHAFHYRQRLETHNAVRAAETRPAIIVTVPKPWSLSPHTVHRTRRATGLEEPAASVLDHVLLSVTDMGLEHLNVRKGDRATKPEFLYQRIPARAATWLFATAPDNRPRLIIPHRAYAISKTLPTEDVGSDLLLQYEYRRAQDRYHTRTVVYQGTTMSLRAFQALARRELAPALSDKTPAESPHVVWLKPASWRTIVEAQGIVPMSYLTALATRVAPMAGPTGVLPDAFVEASVSLNHAIDDGAWMPYHQLLQERQLFRMPEAMHEAFLRWVPRFRPDGREVDTWEFPYGAWPTDELEHWSFANIRTDPNGAASSDWVRYRVGWNDWQTIQPGAEVPVLADGVVVAIFPDVIGRTIVVAHDVAERGWRFHSIYCHTVPRVDVGARVREGDIITVVAESKPPASTHLDFSTAWIHDGCVPNSWPTLFFPAVIFADHFNGVPISEVAGDTRLVDVARMDVQSFHLPVPDRPSLDLEQAGVEEPGSSKAPAARSVVVIPAAVLATNEMLPRELKRLSPDLARYVLLWGDTPLAQEVAAAGKVWVYHGAAAQFVTYLQRFLQSRDATKTHVLTDDTELVSGLSRAAASIKDFGAQIEQIPMESLTLVFKTLGAPHAIPATFLPVGL